MSGINCAYSIDDGGYCTKHSNAFYDAACYLLDGKPCEDRKPVAEPCNNLSKPFKTNADRVRAMSDEELAIQIADWNSGDCPPLEFCPKHRNEETKLLECTPWKCWLDWLRQEAE